MSAGGPGPGALIAGTFLILFGLCIVLVGGGCGYLWLSALGHGSGSPLSLVFLAISAGTLAAGVWCVRRGVRYFRGDDTG